MFHGSIGEGQGTSLHCVTYNSECCTNGQGNWYDQESDGNSDPYVTRGQGVVYLNRRGGGSVGLWRCDIPDSKYYLHLPRDFIHWYSLYSYPSSTLPENCQQAH